MITYFAVVAKYNLVRKEFRAARKFHAGTSYKRLRERQFALCCACTIDCFTPDLTLCIGKNRSFRTLYAPYEIVVYLAINRHA